MELNEIKKIVKSKLSEKRYYHSICVMNMCEELAKIYDADIEKAKKIGLAHDIAKEISNEEKFEYIKTNKIPTDSIELMNPTLLHAKIGKDIAIKQFEFTNEMGQAIEEHTTANINMTMLSKILYISDWIGEDRNFDDTKYLRNLAKQNIDEAILYALNNTITETIQNQKLLHINTVLARNYFITKNIT